MGRSQRQGNGSAVVHMRNWPPSSSWGGSEGPVRRLRIYQHRAIAVFVLCQTAPGRQHQTPLDGGRVSDGGWGGNRRPCDVDQSGPPRAVLTAHKTSQNCGCPPGPPADGPRVLRRRVRWLPPTHDCKTNGHNAVSECQSPRQLERQTRQSVFAANRGLSVVTGTGREGLASWGTTHTPPRLKWYARPGPHSRGKASESSGRVCGAAEWAAIISGDAT